MLPWLMNPMTVYKTQYHRLDTEMPGYLMSVNCSAKFLRQSKSGISRGQTASQLSAVLQVPRLEQRKRMHCAL